MYKVNYVQLIHKLVYIPQMLDAAEANGHLENHSYDYDNFLLHKQQNQCMRNGKTVKKIKDEC